MTTTSDYELCAGCQALYDAMNLNTKGLCDSCHAESMQDYDDDHCVQCNGSGEGQYDGSRCWKCHGKGVVK